MDVAATNGTVSALQEAVDAVVSGGGGNVYIPAGLFNYDLYQGSNMTGVEVPDSVNINIFGAGIGQTVLNTPITNWNYDLQSGQCLMAIGGGLGGKIRLSGITFKGSAKLVSGADDNRYLGGVNINRATDYRIDHCEFLDFVQYAAYVGWLSSGIIDHCIIDNPYRDFCQPHDDNGYFYALWGYGVMVIGDYTTWNPITSYLGKYGAGITYIEDNHFSRCRHSIASNGNSYYVSRHNIFDRSFYGNTDVHGNAGNGIGGRGMESYDNFFDLRDESYGDGQDAGHVLRGGGGVVCNNQIIFNSAFPNVPSVYLIRENNNPPYSIDDLYIWSNTAEDQNGNVIPFNNRIRNDGGFVENSDYYLRGPSQAQDGFIYMPYPYPHPLTINGGENELGEVTFSGNISGQIALGETVQITVTKPDLSTEILTALTLADKSFSTTKTYVIAGNYSAIANIAADTGYGAATSSSVPFVVGLASRTIVLNISVA